MEMAKETRRSVARDGLISVGVYALPVVLMLAVFAATGQRPWTEGPAKPVLR